ncbi:hypothetical protein C0J52_28480 [Blattella germanica]|nr:hypothetical protein C0J52_28480 [Blattella germanica]
MIAPSFFFKILDSFLPVFARNSEILVKNFELYLEKGEFDVHEQVNKCALNVICGKQNKITLELQTIRYSNLLEYIINWSN